MEYHFFGFPGTLGFPLCNRQRRHHGCAGEAEWMCRRGGMEQGCDFSPFAGKKIYFREILEPLIVKEGIGGQAEARIRK